MMMDHLESLKNNERIQFKRTMKRSTFIIIIIALSILPTSAQENHVVQEKLKKLDLSWEKAQLELDLNYADSLLAENFIWVHNHAATTDSKTDVLDRIKRHLKNNNKNTKSRISRDTKVIISGTTAIVTGFTTVFRVPTPTTYNFMRTYVKTNDKYQLVANHTMAIPDKE